MDWSDVLDYIYDNYDENQELMENCIAVNISTRGNRKQRVIIALESDETNFDEEWIRLVSPIGNLDANQVDKALIYLSDFIPGLIKLDELYGVALSVKFDYLEIDDLKGFINSVASIADKLEEKLLGTDEL